MKIAYINLQNNNFLVKTYSQIINNYNVATFKHKFLLDGILKKGIDVCNIIECEEDKRDAELEKAEIAFKENHLNGLVHNIRKEEVNSEDICIVYFHNFSEYIISKEIRCKKILMGNHFVRVKSGQRFELKKDGFLAFVNEADVGSNEFVRKYYNLDGIKLITCPYTYGERFINKVDIVNRSNKILAIGTLSTVEGINEYSGYRDYFGTNWVQPLGVKLLKNRFWNRNWMDVKISYIYQGMMRIKETDLEIVKKIKKKYNSTHEQQGKYLKFDMVETFNKYRFFVRPEELVGMPSINMIEGMACGCVYFGTLKDVYSSIGLIANKHYVEYDGTITDLKKKVKELKKDPEKTAEISQNGMKYVRESFNQNKVSEEYINEILTI